MFLSETTVFTVGRFYDNYPVYVALSQYFARLVY